MAEDDEIDILGEFSFNSCLAQNNHGIPSCSDREDTVHPEWLSDSTVNNWYDKIEYRLPTGSTNYISISNGERYSWTVVEKELLVKELEKYGRDIKKISQSIPTKTEAEIQALIEAEYGVHLDTPALGLDNEQTTIEGHGDVPVVVQEEIVTDDDTPSSITNVINMVTTGSPTVCAVQVKQNKNRMPKKNIKYSKNSLLRPDVLLDIKKSTAELIAVNSSELFNDDDLIIGSMESVGTQDKDSTEFLTKKALIHQVKDSKNKRKVVKKIGNHRRKNGKITERQTSVKIKNRNKELVKSPVNRQRIDSNLSSDSSRSPKLQIVLGSGQALPVSEGEQVIKIEKKKSSDSESDVEVDVDSEDNAEKGTDTKVENNSGVAMVKAKSDTKVITAQRKFEPVRRRQKKINLDGGGGCTIMHTASGDLYEISAEPRKERAPRRAALELVPCRFFTPERPAPYSVSVSVSALVCMEVQAHASRGEVMGLLGGRLEPAAAGPPRLRLALYRPAAAAAASGTHCDMCPVSQAEAAASVAAAGAAVVGWHHSHPAFPAAPSRVDLRTQRALQAALERPGAPFLGLITSQYWRHGRAASRFKCIRVEVDAGGRAEGFELRARAAADVAPRGVPALLAAARGALAAARRGALAQDVRAVCAQAGRTHAEKCLSSVADHLRSAGYADDDPVVTQILVGLRDIFR